MKSATAAQKSPLESLSLWQHQRDAVKAAENYVGSYRAGTTTGSALIHLPTGTGKSGVIAVLSRMIPQVGGVLVVTPRVSLREQLADDIEGRFFRRLAAPPSPQSLPKQVVHLAADPDGTSAFRPKETVFVATVQSYHSWYKRDRDIFKLFRDHVDLVLIDEGHCEPAKEWGEALRVLPHPKVIFTATPYRNDLKLFQIDYAHAYGISFRGAVAGGYIRSVQFLPFPTPGSPDSFVDQILQEYDARFPPGGFAAGAGPRVIIRCEAAERIRLILAALSARGRSCVGIHERFRDDPANPRERKSVPKPEAESATFWVHQFKLLEGLDDPRFRMLAVFDRFTNTRELIQQVGRVVRNPGRQAGEVAHVLDHHGGHHRRLWESYLRHDQELEARGIEATLLPGQKLFQSLLAGQPPSVYVDGLFRRPLDPSGLSPLEDFQVPASATVLTRQGALQCGAILDEIKRHCAERDLSVLGSWSPDARTCIVLYVVVENSPLLRDAHFLETRLAITLVREAGSFAFALDTGGGLPEKLPGIGDPVSPKTLKKLFSAGQDTRLTHVSIKSSNLAVDVVRARSVSAVSVGAIVPYADDKSGVCTRVEGVASVGAAGGAGAINGGDPVRRYLGFRNARVSDHGSGVMELGAYFEWIDNIAASLEHQRPTLKEFERYADDSDAPKDCTPVHLLLDLSEVLDSFLTNNHPLVGSDQPPAISEPCIPVTAGGQDAGTFAVEANGAAFEGTITYLPQRTRYEIACSGLDSYYRPRRDKDREGLIRYLNRTQSFRVLPKTPGYFFSLGQFSHPSFRFGPRYDDDQFGLFKMLESVKRLGKIGTEKGDPAGYPPNGWPADSVFGLIDSLGAGTEMAKFMGNPDLLICDDMQTESADFILGDTAKKRVVLMHAKAKSEASYYSASGLQEVCGQAVKNAKYLAKHNELDSPPNHGTWHSRSWRLENVERNRIRRGTGTGRQIWGALRSLIRDPYSTCEVWLVLGQTISVGGLRDALTANQPRPEAVQAAYLLFSTMNFIQATGARLRVFCSP